MTNTRNRATAVNMVWASRIDDDTPHPDVLEVLAALGVVEPDPAFPDYPHRPRPIVDDDTSTLTFSAADLSSVPGRNSNEPPAVRRDDDGVAVPTRDRSHVPAGLRDLPPSTAPVAPRRKPKAKATPRPRPAPAPPPSAPRFSVDEARRNGLAIVESRTLTVADITGAPTPPTSAPPRPAKPKPASTTPNAPARKRGPAYKPIEHGTRRGYFAHYRRQETEGKPCDACKDAFNSGRQQDGGHHRRRQINRTRDAASRLLDGVFDDWIADAQRSTDPDVRRKAAIAVSSLMALRVAADDLARTERAAAGTPTTAPKEQSA